MIEVGVVSDTHGLVRPAALEALKGVRAILHAGDVGDPEVLEELAAIAPVHAVRGNVDRGAWASALPETAWVELGGFDLYVVHRPEDLDLDPVAAGLDVVITGHSHKPHQRVRDGVLHLNPGSIGPRRFTLPISLARLTLGPEGLVAARHIELSG